jgi:hypothetical protein
MKTCQAHLQQFIYLAGLAQIALVIGSLTIPKILNWRVELAKVQPLIKQMFWTYAAYILVINLCFGLLSALAPREITNGSKLAMLVTAFIALYWLSRVLIQFLYFDRTNFSPGFWNRITEVVLISLFIFLTAVYSWAFYYNY